jgi:hypothetical protein
MLCEPENQFSLPHAALSTSGRAKGKFLSLRLWSAATLATLSLCAQANADLLHRYSFNDGTANDSVGGANGSLMGGAVVSDHAVQFNGTGAYVALPGPTVAINTYTSVTLEMWLTVNPGTYGGYAAAAAFGRTDSDGLGRQYLSLITPLYGGGAWAAITPDFWNVERIVRAGQFGYGQEQYVAITVDSSYLSCFLDGSLAGRTWLGGIALSDLSNELAYLGRSLYAGDMYEVGSINEFRIWNNALSADQVAADAIAGPNVIPEPCALALFGVGAGTLLLRRRRA